MKLNSLKRLMIFWIKAVI